MAQAPPQPEPPDYNQIALNIANGRVALQKRDYASAQQFFDAYIHFYPADPRGYFWNAVAQQAAGDDKAAVQSYLKTLEVAKGISMDSAELRTNLGGLMLKQNYIKEATYDFRRAIEIDPSLDAAHIGLSEAYLAAGKYDLALAELQTLSDKGIMEPRMPFLKAKALEGLGRVDEAKAQLALYDRGVDGASGELMDSARSMLHTISQTDNKSR
ncbi:MAG TPA: tetratricopeptide repeat protein [Planktothrix sp.]|jgi:tetratricopeptide (TPR) repeat protein